MSEWLQELLRLEYLQFGGSIAAWLYKDRFICPQM